MPDKTYYVGFFQTKSNKIRVTDPCYSRSTRGTYVATAREGIWHAFADVQDCGEWGMRVRELAVVHRIINDRDMKSIRRSATEPLPTRPGGPEIGVDSGQAGFFDETEYPNDHDVDTVFYDECCRATDGNLQFGIVSAGVVSASGFGDGGYDLFVDNLSGESTCMRLVFIRPGEKFEDNF